MVEIFAIFAFALFILFLTTWRSDEKHGISYWIEIVIFGIIITAIGVTLSLFIHVIGLALISIFLSVFIG